MAEYNVESIESTIRALINEKVFELYENSSVHKKSKFRPGIDLIQCAGRVYDAEEMIGIVNSALDFVLTSGEFTRKFEKGLCEFLGLRHAVLVNSGSSANLIALSALTSPLLKERRVLPGDEIITVACGFPTTLSPIIQNNLVPVFLDIEIEEGTYNINLSLLEEALSPRTRGVMIAHTLGNPFNLEVIGQFCKKNNLWLVEDNCDALGSTYQGRFTGTFGDLSTSSFYPAHHITTGEGGAVYTNSSLIKKIAESFRDWGRDCWCDAGRDNTCGKRFSWKLGSLPQGYDHKYTYRHFGYNLKLTEMQAAIGVSQILKLNGFIEKRKANWQFLRDGLKDLEEFFILPNPTKEAEPSWFGFALTVRDSARFSRNEITEFLEKQKIQTRTLFAGNLLRHPFFLDFRSRSANFRVVGELKNSDRALCDTFWLGVYPGLNEEMLSYVLENLISFIAKIKK